MRPFLEHRGIEVIETDLGERIQQLDDEPPSHIVVPAVHKLRGPTWRELFAQDDRHRPRQQRRALPRREPAPAHAALLSSRADAGMTGANFAVAETGSFVVCTNEGNADLGGQPAEAAHRLDRHREAHPAHRAPRRVRAPAVAQRARLADHADHLALPRPARRAPRCTSSWSTTAASERLGMADFWTSLKCIRCGACMNTCPVYRRSGGLSYGATYSGPIGVIIDPTFNLRKYSTLPFASTLNGSCTSVCPVKINIHEQIYKWRQVIAERHQLPMVKKEAMQRRRQGAREPDAVSRRGRDRRRGHRAPAALRDLQPAQRLGTAARGAVGAAADLPPVVPEESRRPR